jgi:hypothetical protein
MKTLLSLTLLCLLLAVPTIHSQDIYTVDGIQYSLKTEVEGDLTLLWNSIDGEFRFFSKKGNEIRELKNTRKDRSYQEEYKDVLRSQTSDSPISVDDVKLTQKSLKDFFNSYNSAIDPNFKVIGNTIKLKTRLGAIIGLSNSIYTQNPENTTLPTAGIDFEVYEMDQLHRHSLVFRFKHTFENSSYKYSLSQLSLNYRFKFVKTETIDLFINTKVAAYNYVNRDVLVTEDDQTTTIVNDSGGSFLAPVTFGLGADYAIGNGYLTFSYNDIVGLGIDSNDEFPVDFSIGYKFNL